MLKYDEHEARLRVKLRTGNAGMAELVDAHDSKSCIARCEGSSPSPGTDERSEGVTGSNVLVHIA